MRYSSPIFAIFVVAASLSRLLYIVPVTIRKMISKPQTDIPSQNHHAKPAAAAPIDIDAKDVFSLVFIVPAPCDRSFSEYSA